MNERRNGGIPGGRQSMLGYVLTYSRLKGHTVDSFGFTAAGALFLCLQCPPREVEAHLERKKMKLNERRRQI